MYMKTVIKILILFVFVSCNSAEDKCVNELESQLSSNAKAQFAKGATLNLNARLQCFHWDQLLIESAYATKESIKKHYNVDIPFTYTHGSSDGQQILFFLKNKTVVKYIKFDRNCPKDETCNTVDFLTLVENNETAIIDREDAVFEVYTKKIEDNRGNIYYQNNAIRLLKSLK